MGFAGDWAWGIRDREKRGESDGLFVVKEMEVKRGAMEIIENLLFGDNVKYLQCSKCKVKLSRVDTIVLHSTVGAGGDFIGTLFGPAGHECFRSRGGRKGRGGFPVVTF